MQIKVKTTNFFCIKSKKYNKIEKLHIKLLARKDKYSIFHT